MSAGYSGTPLARKLGIAPGQEVLTLHAPAHYPGLLDLPPGARLRRRLTGPVTFVHAFVRTCAELKTVLDDVRPRLAAAGTLWISWPKKTSKLAAELDENQVRAAGLQARLVDVKVCAVDADWSGLKFVVRLSDR